MNTYKCPECKKLIKGDDTFRTHIYDAHHIAVGVTEVALWPFKVHVKSK